MFISSRLLLPALVTGALVMAGCTGTESADAPEASDRPVVAVGAYPVAFLAERIGGEAVTVELLTSPGVDPHDLELTPAQVVAVSEADLVLTIPGFQPAMDDVAATLSADQVVDLTAGVEVLMSAPHGHTDEHGDGHTDEHGDEHADEHGDEATHAADEDLVLDPHLWLDPGLWAQVAAGLTARMTSLPGLTADDVTAMEQASGQLQADLLALDSTWQDATASCASPYLVVAHAAFGYLARAYGFEQRAIAGLDPEIEPSGAQIAELTQFVRDNDVTTVYYEVLVSPAVAETIAREAGVDTAMLDPLEGVSGSDDYLSVMERNLQTIIAGQGCSS